MANVNSPQSAAMAQAIQFLQQANTVEAEEIMAQHVRCARERHGDSSPQYQLAMNELGIVLLNTGQAGRAIEAFRAACAGPLPDESQPLRDRLTHLMNLGKALDHAGRLDEAEAVLRLGLAGRSKCYGRCHAGYAFGLEPLALTLMRWGNFDDARAAIAETARNFRKNGHPRISTALAYRAEIAATAGRVEPLFDEHALQDLPLGLVEDLVGSILDRAGDIDPGVLRRLLEELLPLAIHRLGEDHQRSIDLSLALANVQREFVSGSDAFAEVAATSFEST
jgi:tetratricopeptide (TPR) repeat protein